MTWLEVKSCFLYFEILIGGDLLKHYRSSLLLDKLNFFYNYVVKKMEKNYLIGLIGNIYCNMENEINIQSTIRACLVDYHLAFLI